MTWRVEDLQRRGTREHRQGRRGAQEVPGHGTGGAGDGEEPHPAEKVNNEARDGVNGEARDRVCLRLPEMPAPLGGERLIQIRSAGPGLGESSGAGTGAESNGRPGMWDGFPENQWGYDARYEGQVEDPIPAAQV